MIRHSFPVVLWVIDGPAKQGLDRANWAHGEITDLLLFDSLGYFQTVRDKVKSMLEPRMKTKAK